MIVEFNPPPGWPVPKGWMPPTGWRKPKSWPEAPTGWEFYLELPYDTEIQYAEPKTIAYSSTNITEKILDTQNVEHQKWWPWDDPNSRFFNPTPTKKITLYKILFMSVFIATLIFMGISTFVFFKTHNSDNISTQTLEKCYTDIRQKISTKASPLNANSDNVLLTLGVNEPYNIGFDTNNNTERTISGTGKGTQNPSYVWYCQFNKTNGIWEYENGYILAQK